MCFDILILLPTPPTALCLALFTCVRPCLNPEDTIDMLSRYIFIGLCTNEPLIIGVCVASRVCEYAVQFVKRCYLSIVFD